MRVALVLYGDLDFISGGFLYDRLLVNYLRHQGDEVQIVSLPWPSYARGLMDNISPALGRRFLGLNVDVILQDELAHPSLFRLNRRLQGRGHPPVVTIVHHLRCSEARPAWQNHCYRLVERRYLASVNAFIFNSRTTRETVRKLVGREKPSVLAFPGADRFQIRPGREDLAMRAHEPGPLRVLFLGTVIPRKGLHTLLAALATLRPETWRLTVVGSLEADRAYVRRIRGQIAAAGLSSQVAFTGPLDEADLAARLAASHVLAVPSSYEGFGIVYLEGMAFGLPALATTAGGAVEIITSGQNGFLAPPGDAAALAAHLMALAADRDLLLSMSLAAQARFAAHPTWNDAGVAVRRFLQSLIPASRGA
uniref:Glycosyltransferase family 1 protein n=1 Tax=Desulfobacca acetoxidans TaxID=60893 RepID=A0A7V6DQ95_9BACT